MLALYFTYMEQNSRDKLLKKDIISALKTFNIYQVLSHWQTFDSEIYIT